jgi:hypothetical protein
VTNRDPCGGGELDIEQNSDAVVIAGNVFERGLLDEDPSLAKDYLVAGIEIAPSHVSNIEILYNLFNDLSSNAIAIDAPEVAPAVKVIRNIFLPSGNPPITHSSGLAENTRNCFVGEKACIFITPRGHLTATLEPCETDSISHCATIIQWASKHTKKGIRLIAEGTKEIIVSNAAQGNVRWISTAPLRVDLYSGYLLLDTIAMFQ